MSTPISGAGLPDSTLQNPSLAVGSPAAAVSTGMQSGTASSPSPLPAASSALSSAAGQSAGTSGTTGTGVAGATQTGAAGGSSTTGTGSSSTNNAKDVAGTDTFLKLLVAQLRNQDPMQPMDDQSFITELAQFNTVEQMLSLKESVNAELSSQQAAEGVALMGKTVSYTTTVIGSGQPVANQGTVSGVTLSGGQVLLQIGGSQVPLSSVTSVSGDAAATTPNATSGAGGASSQGQTTQPLTGGPVTGALSGS